MNQRIEKLRESLLVERFPIGLEKDQLVTESFKQTEGQPQVIRTAKAFANILDNITIFTEDGELLVGNVASKPNGIDLVSWEFVWPEEEIQALEEEDMYILSEEDKALIASMSEYWRGKTIGDRYAPLFDERQSLALETGVILPPREQGETTFVGLYSGGGIGWGGPLLMVPRYEWVLNKGFNKMKEEVEQELRNTKITNIESLRKVYFLQAVIISYEAVIRFANRFAALATELASKEADPQRKKELERIAAICQWVPANPARDFYEAVQSYWFVLNTLSPVMNIGPGRLDQLLYLFYKKDIEEGRITDDEVLELLQCLRVKCSQLISFQRAEVRKLLAGNAMWLNVCIGGQARDGRDATNELSYLILEAAKRCPTPHHTITVLVNEKTPEDLMLKALEVVKIGIGMPAFASGPACIKFLQKYDVPLELAREYVLAGCVDVNIPGQSNAIVYNMFCVPIVFEITMNNGVYPRTGKQVGPRTGDFESFESFDDFMRAFKEQLTYFMEIYADWNNITSLMFIELSPDAYASSLMDGRVKSGKSIVEERLLFDNSAIMNSVGMVNVADSMAAIKKLVFEEKKVTKKEMKAALAANWKGNGYEEIRKMCLAAPKFGNDNNYVDLIAKDLYRFWAETTVEFDAPVGGKAKPAAISISAQWPGGWLTGATPDGRYAGECLADGSMSPMRGRDTKGPIAVIKSAGKIDQDLLSATLMNMKFHPSALNSTEDLRKLSDFIKVYLIDLGGRHIQFNVVSREALEEAKRRPEDYRDLIVRVAGYSAYFTQLGEAIQDEIIGRTQYNGV